MRDLVFFVLVVGFFALAVIFVRACDLILGPSSGFEEDRET